MLYQLSNPDRLPEHLRRLRNKLNMTPGSPIATTPDKQPDINEMVATVVFLLENQLPSKKKIVIN